MITAKLTRSHTTSTTYSDFSGAKVTESRQVDEVVRTSNGLVLGLYEGRTAKIWYEESAVPQWAADALASA
jgi:hypothetical protein